MRIERLRHADRAWRGVVAVALLAVSLSCVRPSSRRFVAGADAPGGAYGIVYRAGFRSGRSDARHHVWPNPQRIREFRSAVSGYDRRCECREQYQGDYRSGFLDGYNRGYQSAQPSTPISVER